MNKSLLTIGCMVCFTNFISSCSDGNHNTTIAPPGSDTSYKVYKIDTINNWYLIYASRKGKRFKIVSKRDQSEIGERIHNNGYYDFKLSSIYDIEIIGGGDFGLRIDSITTISKEPRDSIYDAFWAENVKGLYFLKRQ